MFSPNGGGSRHTASRIYTFKRQVLEFRRATGPLAVPLARLAGSGVSGAGVPFVHDKAQPFFRDVSDHLTRVNESVEGLDRLVSDVLSAHLAQMSVRQNDDMRKISAWAAMAAVPTMIAGIYGMNFDHMPELHWVWAYPAVIAADGGAGGAACSGCSSGAAGCRRAFELHARVPRRAARARGPRQANSGAADAGPPSASRRSGIGRRTMRRQPTSRSYGVHGVDARGEHRRLGLRPAEDAPHVAHHGEADVPVDADLGERALAQGPLDGPAVARGGEAQQFLVAVREVVVLVVARSSARPCRSRGGRRSTCAACPSGRRRAAR